MEKSIIIAGFGGQGVLLAGEVLANAFMTDGKHVTWYPCYGAEMRGGTVNCEIVTSDEEVSSVNKSSADFVVALNQLSFDKFLPKLAKGGCMIANSTLVKEQQPRDDIKYVFAPITQKATDLGNTKIANIYSLGVLAKNSELTSINSLNKGLETLLTGNKKKYLSLNIQAIEDAFSNWSKSLK